jgi:hypothetical protein
MQKKFNVFIFRVIRKLSHLFNKFFGKVSHFLERVEGKTTRIIISKSGSPSGKPSQPFANLFYSAFPHITPIHPALPAIGQKPSVTVFVPSLTPRGFYGGIATLLRTSALLAIKLGYDYRVVQTSGFEKNTDFVLKFLADDGIVIPKERFSTIDVSFRDLGNFAYLPLHPEDIVYVSAWWDAYTASRLPLKKKFVYLIQDYEPIFYNNSDSSVLAHETYTSEKFIPFCNTKTLYEFFSQKGYAYIEKNGVYFEPAVGKTRTKKLPVKEPATKKIFLYGRPEVHRNLFYSAVHAIEIALANPLLDTQKWEVFSAGQDSIPDIKLSTGHVIKNLGKMDLADYYAFAQTIDIAVSPMLAPHPNYPTLEFASLGSAVVSTKYENKVSLDAYSKNIFMAEPDAVSLADHILKATQLAISQRAENLKSDHIQKDWTKACEQPLKELIKKF